MARGTSEVPLTHIEVEVWVRGTLDAVTHQITVSTANASEWTEADVQQLLTQMLLALERESNPGGEPPPVSLRGFSWIVSPYQSGVVLHLEMQMGTASAGPFAVDEDRLTRMISRVIPTTQSAERVH
jgi:hypothetical protein